MRGITFYKAVPMLLCVHFCALLGLVACMCASSMCSEHTVPFRARSFREAKTSRVIRPTENGDDVAVVVLLRPHAGVLVVLHK